VIKMGAFSEQGQNLFYLSSAIMRDSNDNSEFMRTQCELIIQ
jgi:hypothetical protein